MTDYIGKEGVVLFLTEHKGSWFTVKDIAKLAKKGRSSTDCVMKKLRNDGEVKYKKEGYRKIFLYSV